jgi:nucleotide-binding universal stress UspA family protein
MTAARAWTGFRSVLCAVDFSEDSRRALRYAAAVAARGHGLDVAYVNDPLLIAAAGAALHERDLVRRSAKELGEFIDATLTPSVRRRLRLRSHVATGNPAHEILKSTARRRSDLVVLGTHGLTGAHRVLIGSTTLHVLQQTTVPVLAIPRAGERVWTNPSRSWPGKRIVAALELDRGAGHDADVAAHIAAWFGSSLLLVHVAADVVAPAWMTADLSALDAIRIALAQQQLERLVRRRKRAVTTEVRIVSGRADEEIAAVANAERSGLLITALRNRRGWFGARRGSISYHVLTHAASPVLACPPNWRPAEGRTVHVRRSCNAASHRSVGFGGGRSSPT